MGGRDLKRNRNITVQRITELPELFERPRFGQMEGRQHFGERFSQGRDVYQRYGPGQFTSRGGYGGKESFKRDFKPDMYGERRKKDFSFRDNQRNITQKFDDWLD